MNSYNLGLIKALVSLMVLDYLYLSTSSGIFKKIIEDVQKSKFKIKVYPTIVVYILIFFMWMKFIYSVKNRYSLKENIKRGFLLGFFTCGVFEFTNYAIFTKWTLQGVIMDTIWGGILYALITFFSLYKF